MKIKTSELTGAALRPPRCRNCRGLSHGKACHTPQEPDMELILLILYVASFATCLHTAITLISQMQQHSRQLDMRVEDMIVDPAFLPGIAGFAIFPVINTCIAILLVWHWIEKKA
jgi:hypothetical protein